MPEGDNSKGFLKNLWSLRIEILSGLFVLLGVILSLFYTEVSSGLVGLGCGACFFGELNRYFSGLKGVSSANDIFKTLMLLGLVIFLLVQLPFFVIALGVGYLWRFAMNHLVK